MVLFRAGVRVILADWVMEEHLNKIRPRSRVALEQIARPSPSHQATPIIVPSSTMVLFHAGVQVTAASWVMEGHLNKIRPRSRVALERVARPSPSHPEETIPVQSSTMGLFRVGD